jgi:hypothetical protein
MKFVPEHDEIKQLSELAHYEAHPERTESKLFKQVKEHMHKENIPCFINNKYCEGDVEIHHNIIEYSAASAVDWDKVKQDHPEFTDVDQRYQMIALCSKHHRGKYTGIHNVTYPIWILQKYMNEEALEDFENAVKQQLQKIK